MFKFRFILFYFIIACSLYLFNSCANKNPILITTDTSSSDISQSVNTVTKKIRKPDNPTNFNYFPYDLQLDTIAYMSCDTSHFFTLKTGSYFNKSGLRLSEYFLKKKLNSTQLNTLIQKSTKYKATPVISAAHKYNFNVEYTELTTPFETLLRLHSTVDLLTNSKKTRLNTYSGDDIEVSIKYPHTQHNTFANNFNEHTRLLLSYRDSDSNMYYTTGGEPGLDIYGRLYKLQFETQNNRNILTDVFETRLPAKKYKLQKKWSCLDSLNFQIRRHKKNAFTAQKSYDNQTKNYKSLYNFKQSTGEASLDGNTDIYISNENKINSDEILCPPGDSSGVVFNIVKKVLGNDWNINVEEKCISLKNSDKACYLITQKSSPDYRISIDNIEECESNKAVNYCPQYLSICIRHN